MRLNGPEAADAKAVLNFDFGDDGKYMVELVNGVLNNTPDYQADNPDATLTLSRDTLNRLILHETTLEQAVVSGDLQIDGDQNKFQELISYLDTFEFWFDIVTPGSS